MSSISSYEEPFNSYPTYRTDPVAVSLYQPSIKDIHRTDNEEEVKKLISALKNDPDWNPNDFFFWGDEYIKDQIRSPQTLKLLFENGANPLFIDSYGKLILSIYGESGSPEHMLSFISAGVTSQETVTIHVFQDRLFFYLIEKTKNENLQPFLDNGYSLELTNRNGHTPLEFLVMGPFFDREEYLKKLRFIASKGVNPKILESLHLKFCKDLNVIELICENLPKEVVKARLQKEIIALYSCDYSSQNILNNFQYMRKGKQKSYAVLSNFLKTYFSEEEAEVHAMAYLTFRDGSPDNYLDEWENHPNRIQLIYKLVTQYPISKWSNQSEKKVKLKVLSELINQCPLSVDQIFLFAPFMSLQRLHQTVESAKKDPKLQYLNDAYEEMGIRSSILASIEDYLDFFETQRVSVPATHLILQHPEAMELAHPFRKILFLKGLSVSAAAEYLKALPLNERGEMILLASTEQKKAYAETVTLYDFIDANQKRWSGPDFQSKMDALNQLEGLLDEQQEEKFKAIRDEWFQEKLELDIYSSKKRIFFRKLFDQIRDFLPDRTIELEIQENFEKVSSNTEKYQKKIVSLSSVLLLRELVIDPPAEFVCGILKELMVNPYVCKKTGQHFEFDAINSWLNTDKRCPVTREPRTIDDYESSPQLLQKIESWKRKQILNASLKTEQLKEEMRQLADKNGPEEVKRKRQITQEYARLKQEKLSAVPVDENFIQTLGTKTVLKAGTLLYHCSSKAKIEELLSKGIEQVKSNEYENSFKNLQMGQGLYLSIAEPAYLSEGRDNVLVFEVVDDIKGYNSLGIEELLNSEEIRLSQEEIKKQYASLQRKFPFLRQEGLYPKDTEIVMGRTDSRIKIVSLAVPPYYNDKLEYRSFDSVKHLQLHKSWKAIEVVEEHFDHFKLKKKNKEFFFKFMRKDQRRSQIHEICGSSIAHKILGPLVPKAIKYTYKNKKGVAQKWIEMKSLSKTKQDIFDPSKLTSLQLEQMIAHWLVDRLIGNKDNHSNQFGLAALGNVIGFDKGSAFKNFESSLPFMEEKADEVFCAYENIRHALRTGRIMINFKAPVIVMTLQKIEALTKEDIRKLVMPVAKVSYSDNIDEFVEKVYQNSRNLLTSLPTA